MTTTRFFIYGSLCEGMFHFSKISNFIENSVAARTKASAYRLKVGLPALIRGGADLVAGQLVEMKGSDLLVSLLDEFFGFNRDDQQRSLFTREQVEVYPEGDSKSISAWVYFLNPLKMPLGATLIPNGDWQRSLDEKPSLLVQLSEKQKQYIGKLGKSTGREVVPIDLTLYRELMGMDLIVDKGRRLALSKLGQEVYRFLP